MARTSADGQNNSKLDSFLKRNTSRDVYERIRVSEPCVVVSGSVKKVFMHVILSDECVYLSEYHPRALREALSFRHITSIELVRKTHIYEANIHIDNHNAPKHIIFAACSNFLFKMS